MAKILDGKALAAKITSELALTVQQCTQPPHLVVIIVGENPASQVYVRNKKKQAEATGFKSTVIAMSDDTAEISLIEKIHELNNDNSVHAILVQLPLPKHICEKNIIAAILPEKDVDGFTAENSGRLLCGDTPYACPCTPKGIMRILKEYDIPVAGKHAVVVGRSNIVGKPVSVLLLEENATVTICHSKTENLTAFTSAADILISATGQKIITADMVKKGAVVIDVGISRDSNGKLSGDVDFHSVKEVAGYITPVPGGVGPMTIAMLLENTLQLFLRK